MSVPMPPLLGIMNVFCKPINFNEASTESCATIVYHRLRVEWKIRT